TRHVSRHTPNHIGELLASFCPTYVAGLIRIDHPDYFSTVEPTKLDAQRHDFDTVRRVVHAANPDTLFDIHLSATKYETWDGATSPLKPVLQNVKETFDPDAIFFDFFVCKSVVVNPTHDPDDFDTMARADYESRRAADQDDMTSSHDLRYRYTFNVFFPSCVPAAWDDCCVNPTKCAPHACNDHQVFYDATRD